jgi:hypothetical protein
MRTIDLSVFDERYKNGAAGAAAVHPKILLKVILLAYANGMLSSRQIERACRIFVHLSHPCKGIRFFHPFRAPASLSHLLYSFRVWQARSLIGISFLIGVGALAV